jgi:hypothetical protein
LPEILLEIAARTGFTDAFTHITERTARAADLSKSLCAVLLRKPAIPDSNRWYTMISPLCGEDRLSWVNQNYIRDETLTAANANLVSLQCAGEGEDHPRPCVSFLRTGS